MIVHESSCSNPRDSLNVARKKYFISSYWWKGLRGNSVERVQEVKGASESGIMQKRTRNDAKKLTQPLQDERQREHEKAYVKRQIASEEKCEEIKRAPDNRLKRGQQQRESELLRSREIRGGNLNLVWIFLTLCDTNFSL